MDNKFPESLLEMIDLEEFRKRPGMYIGFNDIHILKAFVDGNISFGNEELAKLFWQFRNWLAPKSKHPSTTGGWNDMILEMADNDHKIALELFFKYFDEFREA